MRAISVPTARGMTYAFLVLALCCALFAGHCYYRSSILFLIVERYEHERQQRRAYYFSGESEGSDAEQDDFCILLNRAPDYLRDTAISYARSYDLGEPVSELYAGSCVQSKGRRTSSTKQKRARRRMRHFSSADLARWEHQKKVEPIFDVPIERGSFWLSSPFGPRREPGGGRGFHFGIDMAAVRGTLVKAAGDGTVIFVGSMPGYGNVIVIKHDGKFKTRYAHLSKILTKYGEHVQAGKVIGKVGSTGNSRSSGKMRDASHLHFEVEMYGKRVNPFYFFK